MRTAAATAVAAKYLADAGTEVATVIGCGVQGRIQLLALLTVLPLKKIFAYDIDSSRCASFARSMTVECGLPVIAIDAFEKGTRSSQAIVTCTSSRSAFLGVRHVSAGSFIAAVGADNHDKQELDPQLMKSSKVVVDILDQCAQIGDLHHALEIGALIRSDVCAELGAVVSGRATVRQSSKDIVVFDSTGSAIQDVAAAGIIYERASAAGLGLKVDLP
jgi:ornithine cyclodeaminase/alanine dehydrogenase-like protein (mu-crystallin family)